MLCVAGIEVMGQSGYCGRSVKWRLLNDGTLYLSGSGEMYDYDVQYYSEEQKTLYPYLKDEDTRPWASYRYEIKNVEIYDGITNVGRSAFEACENLQSVSIGNAVKHIGSSAFEGCTGEIPSSVTEIGSYAFEGCTGLTSVEIPSSVTEIGGSAFSDCTSLASVDIPNSVTDFGSDIFEGCSNLTNPIYNDSSFIYMPPNYAGSSYTIPNGIRRIATFAFSDCTSLTGVEIPSSVTEIGGYAFRGCTGLTSVEIPSSVTEIGSSAFEG